MSDRSRGGHLVHSAESHGREVQVITYIEGESFPIRERLICRSAEQAKELARVLREAKFVDPELRGLRFPVLENRRACALVPETPRSVPWAMLAPHESQALANHDQSLKKLASRGGLDVCELLCVIDGVKWKDSKFNGGLHPVSDDRLREAVESLIARVKGWESENP